MRLFGEQYAGKVGFAIGTGRCGTLFFARALGMEPHVAACHERNPENETFHRYCQWYGLKVDHEGFLYQKKQEIDQDLSNHRFSFESSAFLSLSVMELYQRFDAKFLLLLRSPERVVNSFLYKGWYRSPRILGNTSLAPGYQQNDSFHHFLARFFPTGELNNHWNKMSRVGKISWYWNAMNERILEQFSELPETHWRIEKIEDLSYKGYEKLADFFGFSTTISAGYYNELTSSRPNKFLGVPTIASWNVDEVMEFEEQIEPMALRLGYEYRVSQLPIPQTSPETEKEEKFWGRFFKPFIH